MPDNYDTDVLLFWITKKIKKEKNNFMAEDRIKTHLWISAEIRRCEVDFIPAMVMHKGDPERGQILINHYQPGEGNMIYMPRRDMAGLLVWHQPLGTDPVDDQKAQEYINRQRGYDEDLWVIEIEDLKGLYQPSDLSNLAS